ncbi:hypothetical protein [uncultured Microbacterium sp.]|uniref:hypothetical protein n=1 Tax=uncultured Microbacterium sp. TaxID=191216 RepID=UPI0028DB828E|nr:hypothetical protein [uncultured Microbacterium sp.]
MTRLLRVDDATLAGFAVRAGSGRDARAALGAELDAATDVLLLGDLDGPGPDRTAAAAALLAITRRVVVVPIVGARQHPINLARTIATLSNLHERRVGLAATSAAVLALISRLFETWPLDAVARDTGAEVFVDDSRIVRIDDPEFPSIGGPLTVPVDVLDKPVTVLLSSTGSVGPGVDIVLDAASLPVWVAGTRLEASDDAGESAAGGARAVFGVGASVAFATGTPAFAGPGRLTQV